MEILDELTLADARLAALAAENPAVDRLTTSPAIGPITAIDFIAATDVHRFLGRRGRAEIPQRRDRALAGGWSTQAPPVNDRAI
jgi:hypothetical protein